MNEIIMLIQGVGLVALSIWAIFLALTGRDLERRLDFMGDDLRRLRESPTNPFGIRVDRANSERYKLCLLFGHIGSHGNQCLSCGFTVPQSHRYYAQGETHADNSP